MARGQTWLSNRWVRILGVAFVMHIISFIDRTNIAMAIPAMRAELKLSASTVGFATGSLFFAYMVLQIPAARLATTWSVRKLIFFMAIAWGIASLSAAFVHGAVGLTLNRLAVGLCEGGEMTAVIILIRHWFTRGERAKANTLFMMSVPLSSVIASPISGLLLQHFGWRQMFVIEALPAFIWAFVWLALITDRPAQAAWLPQDERQRLETELAAEERAMPKLEGHWRQVLVHPAVILLTIYNLLTLMASWGINIWLPTLLKEGGISIATVGFLAALPYAAGAVMMYVGLHQLRPHAGAEVAHDCPDNAGRRVHAARPRYRRGSSGRRGDLLRLGERVLLWPVRAVLGTALGNLPGQCRRGGNRLDQRRDLASSGVRVRLRQDGHEQLWHGHRPRGRGVHRLRRGGRLHSGSHQEARAQALA